MARLQLSYGQVEAVLAHLNHIAQDKRVAFQARLKHLQRLNFPEGTNTGKGKPARYTFESLMQLVIAVELLQTGLPPQMAAKLVEGSWGLLRHTVYLATHSDEEWEEWQEMPFGPETREWLWLLSPEALRDLSNEGVGRYDHMEAIIPVPLEAAARQLEVGAAGVYGESWRTLVLYGSRISAAVIEIVAGHFGYATVVEIREDIQEELRRLEKMLEDTPLEGVEEGARSRLDLARKEVSEALSNPVRSSRYFPSQAALDRQAEKALIRLPRHQLAYLAHGQFGGEDLADIKALTALMMGGYLFPTGSAGYELSPLGRLVQEKCRDLSIPRQLIEEWREKVEREIREKVQRRIDALLARDPDFPEDDADLERWARHGGTRPTTEGKRREPRDRLVTRLSEEINADPGFKEAVDEQLTGKERQDGNDPEA